MSYITEGTIEGWAAGEDSAKHQVAQIKWWREMFSDITCDVCGEKVFEQKDFIYWRGTR